VSKRLERSVLLVPASNWGMIQKTAASAADAVCIDLEDAVAPNEKEASRANVARAFTELDFGARLKLFRMNGLDTGWAYRDLVEIVEVAGHGVDLVVVPKVNGPEDVRFVDTLLGQIEAHRRLDRRIGIEALIETAQGYVNLREIAASSPRLEGFVYGSGDYAASMHMPMTAIGELDDNDALYPGHRWHAVMHGIVATARAFGKRAVDGPFAGIRNEEGLERACRIGRAMGFDGKWCIHPSQVGAANRVFAPTAAEIGWAEKVLETYQAALVDGRGAITVAGKMIDVASLRMAQTIADRARAAGLRDAPEGSG
jgi:citrate lyase beta subunit